GHQLDQGPAAEAAAALGRVTVVLLTAGGPGDVEVGPRHAVDELLEEQPGRQSARVAVTAGVLDVGDLGIDLLAVVVGQGKRPGLLPGPVGRGLHLLDPAVVVTHEAGDLVPQGDHARAGQGGQVDDGVDARLD